MVMEYNASGTVLRRYVHGTNADADDPLIWYEGSSTNAGSRRFLLANHQGSIIAVTNYTGALLNANTYDAYGIPGSTNQGRFQYTGQVWLPELGMYYYKARIYSPSLGRFLQTDPIGYEDGFNLYRYFGNDPVNNVDPTGLQVASAEDGDFVIDRTNPDFDKNVAAADRARHNAADPTNGDRHLNIDEANLHYRVGNGAPVDVDATQLTIRLDEEATQTGETVSGTIMGFNPDNGDYWVHGRNNATLQTDGSYRLVDGPYDFDQQRGGAVNPRNIDTVIGERVATRNGRTSGQAYIIRYHGAPNVIKP